MGSRFLAACCALVAAGCFGSPKEHAPPQRQGPSPALRVGAWSFWGEAQGLSRDVQDVSADEGGNVYVAGGEAVFAKGPADPGFYRFDSSNAGLTASCNDFDAYYVETPAKPFYQCRVLAVAGAAPGKAFLGFDGYSVEPQKGASWTYHAGGVDVVAFDAAKHALARTRHVWIASAPHTICTTPVYGRQTTCDGNDYWWVFGRRITTLIRRIVVNHDRGSPMYGDAWVGGHHATLAAVLSDPGARGFFDRTAAWGAGWADAKDVWEHEHPNLSPPDGSFVNGEGWGLSIDPRNGTPWGSNEYRITAIAGPYGANLSNDDWWQWPILDVWPDPAPDTPNTPADDHTRSLSHCKDGSLWIGSTTHGLARLDPDGVSSAALSYRNDADTAQGVSAVACDPSDASIWIGLANGGVKRLHADGTFERVDASGWPDFTRARAVQSIQIDAWSPHRTVWLAFPPTTDQGGKILTAGGVAAFSGP